MKDSPVDPPPGEKKEEECLPTRGGFLGRLVVGQRDPHGQRRGIVMVSIVARARVQTVGFGWGQTPRADV